MRFLLATLFAVALLLIIEKAFRLDRRGRTAIVAVVLAWAFWNAVQSARINTEHPLLFFAMSFGDSAIILGLWWWASIWLREAAARRQQPPAVTTQKRPNSSRT